MLMNAAEYLIILYLFIGCGKLFAVDGNWKLCYPICMYRVPKEMSGFDGALQYVDSCPNEPTTGMAFCGELCQDAWKKGIPCTLQEFLKFSLEGLCTFLLSHAK